MAVSPTAQGQFSETRRKESKQCPLKAIELLTICFLIFTETVLNEIITERMTYAHRFLERHSFQVPKREVGKIPLWVK
jgi:hypothetical protein